MSMRVSFCDLREYFVFALPRAALPAWRLRVVISKVPSNLTSEEAVWQQQLHCRCRMQSVNF